MTTPLRQPLLRAAIRTPLKKIADGQGRVPYINRGSTLLLDPIFHGPVIYAGATETLPQSWVNDPATLDRVGRYAAGSMTSPLRYTTLASIIPHTRGSSATDVNASGQITLYAADEFRGGYDLVGNPQGFLIEGAVTNTILNNVTQAFSTGAAGNSSAVSTDILPLYAGATIIKHIRGDPATAIDNNLGNINIGTPGASTRITVSCWMYVPVSFTGTNPAGLHPSLDAASANHVSIPYNLSAKGTWQRVSRTLTTGAGQTGVLASQLRPTGALNGDIIYTHMWQCETTDYATSVIPTTGSAASRQFDNFSLSGAQFIAAFGDPSFGCVIAEVLLDSTAQNSTVRSILQIEMNSTQNRLEARPGSSNATMILVPTLGGSQGSPSNNAGAPTYGAPMRLGLRWTGTTASISVNGGVPQSVAYVPPLFNTLRVGSTNTSGTLPMNGRLRHLRAMSFAPDDATFRALTTVGA